MIKFRKFLFLAMSLAITFMLIPSCSVFYRQTEESIKQEMFDYLEEKYDEKFSGGKLYVGDMFDPWYYVYDAYPVNNADIRFKVMMTTGSPPREFYDRYLLQLLKPEVENRFINITEKYFGKDYKFELVFAEGYGGGNFFEGFDNNTTIEELITSCYLSKTSLIRSDAVVFISEDQLNSDIETYIEEVVYQCGNLGLRLYVFSEKFYESIDIDTITYDNYKNDFTNKYRILMSDKEFIEHYFGGYEYE